MGWITAGLDDVKVPDDGGLIGRIVDWAAVGPGVCVFCAVKTGGVGC